jgi:hypothetical protein
MNNRRGYKVNRIKGYKAPTRAIEFKPEAISLPGEEWRPLVGWERVYRVSNMGRVYSLIRGGRFVGTVHDRYVGFNARDNGRNGSILVHRAVLETFVGPAPEGMEACHNNGIPSDNRLSNLRWGTHTENLADREDHGTNRYQGDSILNPSRVSLIRTHAGIPDHAWAKEFGLGQLSVMRARLGVTWKDVPTPTDPRRPKRRPLTAPGKQP